MSDDPCCLSSQQCPAIERRVQAEDDSGAYGESGAVRYFRGVMLCH
jgi:hypothetical protein